MESEDRPSDGWIEMLSGQPFWPLAPRVDEIHIEDGAHALSNLCRFNGHVETFYSVAQHSVLVAEYVEKQLMEQRYWHPNPRSVVLAALMHDFSEAYLVDVPRPVKRQMLDYIAAEKYLEAVIRDRFNLTEDLAPLIKLADDTLLATEKRDLKPNGRKDWRLLYEPIARPYMITSWTPEQARKRFLWKFNQLADRNLAVQL